MNKREETNVEEPKKKVNKTDETISKLTKDLAESNEKYLRLAAEFQNMKRRTEIELSNYLKYEGESFLLKLLPIVDDFERAISMDDNNLTDEVSKFLSGFKMIYAKLISILEENEVKVIDCLDKEFDPNIMQAMLTDKDETKEHNIVLDVLQKGYLYKDKLLRPAMVKVNE